jgi:hypothetical protein
MDTTELIQWYINNNIEKETIDAFWNYFNNYRKEEIYDFEESFGQHIDERLIRVKADKVQLTHIFESGDFIYSILDIYYLNDYIAEYKLVFTLDGEVEDDVLRLQPSSYVRKLTAEANRSIEIAEKSIKENLDLDLISRIVGLDIDFIKELKDSL